MTEPMSSDLAEVYHQLRTGDLTIAYARHDERSGVFYCTLRPRQRVVSDIPSVPNALALALSSTDRATGFFANLTPEQQKAALEYDGPENHGGPAMSSPQRGGE